MPLSGIMLGFELIDPIPDSSNLDKGYIHKAELFESEQTSDIS